MNMGPKRIPILDAALVLALGCVFTSGVARADDCSSVCTTTSSCGQPCEKMFGETKETVNCSYEVCDRSCKEICVPTSSPGQVCTSATNSASTCKESCKPAFGSESSTADSEACFYNPDASGSGSSSSGNAGGISWSDFEWVNQSSTDFGGDADRANDGSADGNFDHGSVSHTAQQDYPEWWGEVKGGTSFGDVHMGKPLEKIYVYSRTDCCTNRLEGAEVWVHTNFKNRNGTFGQPWIKVATLNGRRAVYEILGLHNIGAIHQVKVRIPKKQAILSLAEVRLLTHD